MSHLIKILRWSVSGLGIFVLIVITFVVLYRCDNYMFGWEAGLYWGRTPFVSQQFREAAANEKAAMVEDLISKKYFIGKSIEQVELELGPSTGGYYNSDANRTYIVHTDEETTWDIVFVVDHSTGNAERILIYKRRGGITRKALGAIMRIADKWL